jgi:hypothetical protein
LGDSTINYNFGRGINVWDFCLTETK